MDNPRDFSRTRQTADDAEATARLLERAAKGLNRSADDRALERLAERYRDYAAGLRECIPAQESVADPDQAVLI